MSKLEIVFHVYPYEVNDIDVRIKDLNNEVGYLGTIDKNGYITYTNNQLEDEIPRDEKTLLHGVALEIKKLFNAYMLTGVNGFLIYRTYGECSDLYAIKDELCMIHQSRDFHIFRWSVLTTGSGYNLIGANLITSSYYSKDV